MIDDHIVAKAHANKAGIDEAMIEVDLWIVAVTTDQNGIGLGLEPVAHGIVDVTIFGQETTAPDELVYHVNVGSNAQGNAAVEDRVFIL